MLKNEESTEATSIVLLVESYLLTSFADFWCIDSGPTFYVCNTLQGFQISRKLNDGELVLLTVMSGMPISTRLVSNLKLAVLNLPSEYKLLK